MLSKKHYKAIAAIIQDIAYPHCCNNHYFCLNHAELVERFTDYFGSDNPRFSPIAFSTACKPKDM